MNAKKSIIERAKADGSIDRMNQLLSASHLLLCEANNLLEESADVMLDEGLLLGKLKSLHNMFVKSADRYFHEFASMVTSQESKMDMFSDLEGFDNAFREWAKVPKEWKRRPINKEE